MAQDPESKHVEPGRDEVNLSHDRDLVPLFSSQTFEADMDAENIQGVLESNGITSVLERGPLVAAAGIEILVARDDLDRARSVIADALAAGPEGAAEAESDSELPSE